MSTTETIAKIDTFKVFGDGKALLGAGSKVNAGRIIGSVEKVISRTIPGGGKYEGLAGVFEVSKSDGGVKRSGQCYFPASIHKAIADKLGTDGAARLDLIVSVDAIKADTADGFTWSYTPERIELNADPLAHLRGDQGEKPLKAAAKK